MNGPRRASFGFWLVGALILASACASTQVASTWKNPTYKALPRTVLVVATVPTESVRLQIEQNMAAKLAQQGVLATPLSQVIQAGRPVTRAEVEERLRVGNFDGLLVARFQAQAQPENTVPVPTAGGAWGGFLDEASWTVTQASMMTSNLYDARTRQLIWTGTSNATSSTEMGMTMTPQDASHYASVIVEKMTSDLIG
jgi:hypothetical protein